MLGKEMGYEISTCQKQYDLGNNRGGIGVFIKYESFPHVTAIDSDSDYIFWFMISKVFLKTDEDVVFGAVYVPPSESRINTQGELYVYQVEICNTCILHKYVCFLGDFNVRTHNKDDFLDEDDFFVGHLGLMMLYGISSMFQFFTKI